MWLQFIFLLEIFSTLSCIHCIFGEKICRGIGPILVCTSLLVIYEVANVIPNGGGYSLIAYIPIFVYCKRTFGKSVVHTLAKMIWLIILLTAIEFLSVVLVAGIGIKNLVIRNMFASVMVFLISVLVLPRLHIDKIILRGRVTKILLGVVVVIMILIACQGKFAGKINGTLYFVLVPFILGMLYFLVKWSGSQAEMERMKQEADLTYKMDAKYEELVEDIRTRQHGFKNQITAILSAHYTYDTYENLVEAQEEYCKKLIDENQYSQLLQLKDKVLVGFLYEKFREIEDRGIEIKYEVNTFIENCVVPTYYLVDMLGILLDNAMEATKSRKQCILFSISEEDSNYVFRICNPMEYISYQEIERWFQKGESSKGQNRGVGLYHLKCLCQKHNCNICCRNIEKEEENWIEFSLAITKASRI